MTTNGVRRMLRRFEGWPIEDNPRRYWRVVEQIDAIGAAALSDGQIAERAQDLRRRVRSGEPSSSLRVQWVAVAREACARAVGLRPFDLQVIAGLALDEGRCVQMATGEGKTLAAVLPASLNALSGRGVHVLTANDYLARRDAEWMRPAYRLLGLTVASIGQEHGRAERRAAYAADITYVTAKEAGFDFLRDQTMVAQADQVQRPFNYVIVDEADFILIDEARVPLVIAGPAPSLPVSHEAIARLVRLLRPGVDFSVDEYARNVTLTPSGFASVEARLGCAPLHAPGQQLLVAAIHVALHAQQLLHREHDYIVRAGRIELVDEFTGRVAADRRWPHGIQPALEAKEGLAVTPEGRILGSIPIQHFVRLWPRIAGMTATAEPAAAELQEFYGLKTVVLPPRNACVRSDEPDRVFASRRAKQRAIVDEVVRVHASARPVLVGTASVAESEELADALRSAGVKCRVLNARHDAREALIVSRAGMPGAVTISTNMAGRGTDIVLGGGDPALHAQVAGLGGLLVIGTNRHESRRVDDQLRGRAGRQGDPGSAQFFVSLEDDLVRRYGVMDLIPANHRPAPGDDPVADPEVRDAIAQAQRVIEGQNFEIRRTLWRYSSMVEEQRLMLARLRQELLDDDRWSSFWEAAEPEAYTELRDAAGGDALREVERRLALVLLDRRWSDYLALIEDIREGIHLQRYGGRIPLTEFQRQIIDDYGRLLDGWQEEVLDWFPRVVANGGSLDFAKEGLLPPTSTWTYLVNDNPLPSFALRLIATGNYGTTLAASVIAIVYLPVTIVAVLVGFVRRRRVRGRVSPGEPD